MFYVFLSLQKCILRCSYVSFCTYIVTENSLQRMNEIFVAEILMSPTDLSANILISIKSPDALRPYRMFHTRNRSLRYAHSDTFFLITLANTAITPME